MRNLLLLPFSSSFSPSAPSKRHENFLSWCGTYFPIAKEEVAALLFSQACDLFIRSYAWKNVERMQNHVPFASQRFCAHLEKHGMSGTLFVRALELLLPPIETFLLPQYYKEVVDFSSKVHGWDVSTLLEIVDAVAHHSDPNPPEESSSSGACSLCEEVSLGRGYVGATVRVRV